MKKVVNKGAIKKVILALVIAITMNFACPIYSQADIGGILFDPISSLVTSIGDVILSALQYLLYDGKFDVTGASSNIFGGAGDLANVIAKYPDMKFDTSKTQPIVIDKEKFKGNLVDLIVSAFGGDTYVIPTIQYSIDNIFAGKIPAFDINFISPKDYGSADMNEKSVSYQTSNTVAKWYNAIRNLSVIGLLSVLVYSGIRILISSSVDDRAKYKQRIFDWLVAMCLIFFIHYIMLFTITMVDVLNGAIGGATSSIPVRIVDGSSTEAEFNTNLMGLVRIQVQYNDFTSQVTFLIFYIGLLVYTVKFTWVYMKRLITLMFLTIIAPLVAMTYPIDKMNDGKAQAFNTWLKEYIFTALIQPFHLIIYSVLVGSAIEIVKVNPIYAIMVVAFMGPAEKLLRKFFGFDKASTPGALSQAGNMLGGAAAWNMIKKGAGMIAGKKAPGGGGNGGSRNVRTRGGSPVENADAPSGYDAFAESGNNQIPAMANSVNNNEQEAPQTTAQAMADVYDEGFGTSDWDPQVSDAMNREAYADSNEGMRYSADEYAQILRDSGYEEDEIKQMVSDAYGSQDEEEDTNERNRRRSFLRTAGAIALAPARGVGRSIKNSFNRNFAHGRWKRTLGRGAVRVARFAGRVAVAGTAGVIGAGLGVAGDDLEDVLKLGGTATALGYSMAPSLGRRIANTDVAQSISLETQRAIYGSDNAAAMARQERELRDSGELRDFAQETFIGKDGNQPTGSELNELEDRAIGHYNNGFTDTGDIKKVMKLEDKMIKEMQSNLPEQDRNDEKQQQKMKERAKEMSETIGKIAKDITPGKLSDQKYVDGKLKEFERGIKKSNPNLSDAEVKGNASQMMNYVMQYYKKP
jgi:hypothetical protein